MLKLQRSGDLCHFAGGMTKQNLHNSQAHCIFNQPTRVRLPKVDLVTVSIGVPLNEFGVWLRIVRMRSIAPTEVGDLVLQECGE